MIDSITLKIHNLVKYPLLVEQFYNFDKRKKNRILEGYLDVSTGEIQERQKERVVLHSGDGKFLPTAYTSNLYVASSDYSISVRVDCKAMLEASLEMTFSIPKYIWGVNIFQFISFPPKSSEATFHKLLLFLKEFFKKEFLQQPSWYDVEVKRIDLCYNQFFANKAEALSYQQEQWEQVRVLARSKNARFSPGNGSNWTLLTQGYSFKCYHKGDEFAKNDLPKLMKGGTPYKMPRKYKNGVLVSRAYKNEGVAKRWNLHYLVEQADRILRYEITYRRSFMHYMVSYTMFQAMEEQPGYILENSIYRYVRRADKMGMMKVARAIFTTDDKGVGRSGVGNFVTNDTLKENYCRFVRSYMLKSTFDGAFSPGDIYEKKASFNEGVFRLLFNVFWDKVKEVQINERSNVPEAVEKIKAYQARCKMRKDTRLTVKGSMTKKGGVNTARLALPAILSQFMDLRELKRYLPRNTYQRLMSDCKKAELPMRATELTIVRPMLDYTDYMAVLGNLVNNTI